MTSAWKYRALFFGAACVALGCDNQPTPTAPTTDGSNLLWLSSEADALVKCSVAAQCGDGGANFGALSYLSAGGGELEHSRSYMRFPMPKFPLGTKIVKAQLELHHGGKSEDGTSDDVCLDVAHASSMWQPFGVTWNEQPLSSTTGSEVRLDLVSQGWSGADVTGLVIDQLADPSQSFGFVVFANANQNLRKTFDSNAHPSRTPTDLGTAPRLLVHFEREKGGDIEWPAAFDDYTDLPFPGQSVEFAYAETGDDWPAEWEAAQMGQCP
jgi:hypothetical protein